MNCSLTLTKILFEVSENAKLISKDELQLFSKTILAANRIFLSGAGRSGFIARAFANRLMHLGLTVYFVGEPTTPAIQANDLLVINSGSGTTASLVSMAQKAKEAGSKLALLTIFPTSKIALLADVIVKIPGATPKSDLENDCSSFQPMGNLFEQLSWLVCDSIVICLKEELLLSADEMFLKHANLE